jgi:hypothetical protein
MADALWSGRRFRTFNVIDEFSPSGPGSDLSIFWTNARCLAVKLRSYASKSCLCP